MDKASSILAAHGSVFGSKEAPSPVLPKATWINDSVSLKSIASTAATTSVLEGSNGSISLSIGDIVKTFENAFSPTVSAADIICDFKTGDSLCYAFIEFENKKACEMAYFKMDNTLIDDWRIHIDFSQSVSKLWKKFRHGTRTHTNIGGCFKYGAEDHIVSYCDLTERGQRYVLKHENIQHGNDHRRYDKMFDEEILENMEHQGKTKKRKINSKKSKHSRHKDYDRKDSNKLRYNIDRTEGNREDRNRDSKRDDTYLNEGEAFYGQLEVGSPLAKSTTWLEDRFGRNRLNFSVSFLLMLGPGMAVISQLLKHA